MTKSNKIIGGIIPIWVIWLVAIGAIGGIIWAIFFRVPKYAKDTKVEDTDGDGKPDDFNPQIWTDKLSKDLIGLTYWAHDYDLHTEILSMSNGRIHAIYDDWAKRISPTIDGESLPAAIADESSLWDSGFASYQDLWAKRFEQLKLV